MVLSELRSSLPEQLELFALVNLGLVQSMANGILAPTEAVERFYNARNCLYVQTISGEKKPGYDESRSPVA
jgi:hypothetical protein